MTKEDASETETWIADLLIGTVLVAIATLYVHGTHAKLLVRETRDWWRKRIVLRRVSRM